jgi:hypothetical protein
MVEELFQHWEDSVWVNNNKYLSSYEGNNNLIERVTRRWTLPLPGRWVYTEREIYSYDVNNNMIEYISQRMHQHPFYWENESRKLYTYIITGIEQLSDEMKTYSLSNNYPNPFNPTTTIEYSTPKLSFVTLKVFDVLGREVTTIVDEEKNTGTYKVEFDGTSHGSGIYFYQLKAGDYIEAKKMILVK